MATVATVLAMPQAICFAQIIVNIDGLGENYVLNPVFVSLSAGAYRVDVVGTAESGLYDTYSQWRDDNVSNPHGSPVTIPTSNTGWETGYVVTSPDISSVGIARRAIAPGPDPGIDWLGDYFYSEPSTAHYGVFDGLVYPNALSALGHRRISTIVLDASGSVGFGLRDGPGAFGDNRGGLSLRVTPIPEPNSLALCGLTATGLIGGFRRLLCAA